jgi:hypothetical protein
LYNQATFCRAHHDAKVERVVFSALANQLRLRRLLFAPSAIPFNIVFRRNRSTFGSTSRLRATLRRGTPEIKGLALGYG